MIRKTILAIACAYFLGLCLVGVNLYYASPGPMSQAILGVSLGLYSDEAGVVYVSGRHLSCSVSAGDPALASDCKIDVAGKTLEIMAWRNVPSHSNQLGGSCLALYDGKSRPCRIGSRQVNVGRFAYIEDPLGLSKDQLATLRRTYFFENLPEDPFVTSLLVVPVLTALAVLFATAAWLWPKLSNKLLLAFTSGISGAATLLIMFLFWINFTNGFWD